ncbi:MAG: hypothetical protein AABW59_04710 [archaeon]
MYNQPQPWQETEFPRAEDFTEQESISEIQPQNIAPPQPSYTYSQEPAAPEQKKKGPPILIIIVILVVLIIGFLIVVPTLLVVVGLTMQVSNQGSAIPEASAKAAWKSASPFAVMDWAKTTDGTFKVVLKNNSNETLTLSSFTLDSSTTATVNKANISPGSTEMVTLNSAPCTADTKYSYPVDGIKITFISEGIDSEQTESAVADLVGYCS